MPLITGTCRPSLGGDPPNRPGRQSLKVKTHTIYPVGHPDRPVPGKTGKQRRAEKREKKANEEKP